LPGNFRHSAHKCKRKSNSRACHLGNTGRTFGKAQSFAKGSLVSKRFKQKLPKTVHDKRKTSNDLLYLGRKTYNGKQTTVRCRKPSRHISLVGCVSGVPAPDTPAKPKACPDWSGAWSGQAVAGFVNFRPKRSNRNACTRILPRSKIRIPN
jgi:hypothetical protein